MVDACNVFPVTWTYVTWCLSRGSILHGACHMVLCHVVLVTWCLSAIWSQEPCHILSLGENVNFGGNAKKMSESRSLERSCHMVTAACHVVRATRCLPHGSMPHGLWSRGELVIWQNPDTLQITNQGASDSWYTRTVIGHGTVLLLCVQQVLFALMLS